MKRAKLLWIDLEMTGLDPEKDKILEVAAIATSWDLKPLATYEAVVKVDDSIIQSRMVGEFWEKNRKSYNSLVSQNQNGKPITEVEQELLTFLDQHFGTEIYLAGNSIHQDRKFIDRELPQVSQRLHYRMLDVSAWKVFFENALGKKFIKPEAHRALSDIEGSLDELKYYLTFIKK
ncbi:MAG: oligoribonuclease [Bacteroidaceae bacterium]|nr:oligoribonuclease [Bacteroidaceae bacterium]MBR3595201.1 oligoribonuclease [Candidatus Saccharibacteria bacterium]MBR6122710.1 oligoribonuclease [Candidatus Saccharibacteria bacterium]